MSRGSRRLAMSGSIATSVTSASSPAPPLLALGRGTGGSAAGASRRVGRAVALRRLGHLGVRLVAPAHVATHRGPLADHLEPPVEVARELGIAVVAIGLERAHGGRILPRLQDEGA